MTLGELGRHNILLRQGIAQAEVNHVPLGAAGQFHFNSLKTHHLDAVQMFFIKLSEFHYLKQVPQFLF